MSSHRVEQFIRFTTDSVGLERTFRLLQSVAQIISSYPALLSLLIASLELISVAPPSYSQAYTVLIILRQRLGLARRFFRLFRFLDSFNAAQKLYLSISPASASSGSSKRPLWVHLEAYLDVLGRTFNGMYLLLETSTIIDAMQIDGLRAWTPEWEKIVTVEAQRFWLFALVCGLMSGFLKMLKVLAYTPVPMTGDVTQSAKVEDKDQSSKEAKEEKAAEEEFDVKKEQERLRGIVKESKKRRVLWRREVKAKLHGLGRATIANALDIVLPGTVVGWVRLDQGAVGLAMFITTILTGLDAWERCGREIAAAT